jgi:hypothetical protein
MTEISKIMNKITKIIIVGIICYIAFFVYVTLWYGHSHAWNTCKQYLWIFKDSAKKDIDPPSRYSVCAGWTRKRDVYSFFHYYHDHDMYIVTVWEFKDLTNVDLKKISIKQNVNLDNIKFLSGEVLNSKSSSPITINYGFAFHNAMNVNLDSLSKISGTFEGSNYKGFYGTIHKMSFSDEKRKHQIIFDYIENIYNHITKQFNPSFSSTVFLVYKGHQSFYVIIINSEKPFKDASIINILNLQ